MSKHHERLAPPARQVGVVRWWLLLALVVAVVAAGAVVVARTALDDSPVRPSALPPAASASGSATPGPARPEPRPGAPVLLDAGRGPLLPGIGRGQVYAQSATGIFRIELATGRIVRTTTPRLEEHLTFLAGRGWVLVKSRWSPTGVLVRDGQPALPLSHRFDPEGFLHLGPGGRLWVEPEFGTDPGVTTTLRLAELDGRGVPGRTLSAPAAAAPYAIVADGYGGMLLTNLGGSYRLVPSRPGRRAQIRLVSRGDLLAVGGRRLLVWDCDTSARCHLLRVDERTGRRTELPAVARALAGRGSIGTELGGAADQGNLLSPDGRWLAAVLVDSTGTSRVHVIDLRSGADARLPGSGTESNANRQLAWSPNSRWLLALTDQRIRAYDTRTHVVRNPRFGTESLLHLTIAGTAGW